MAQRHDHELEDGYNEAYHMIRRLHLGMKKWLLAHALMFAPSVLRPDLELQIQIVLTLVKIYYIDGAGSKINRILESQQQSNNKTRSKASAN
jgi:hypothetical protein